MKALLGTLFIALLISPVQAKRYSNKFLQFELPLGWDCFLEGTEYICQSSDKKRAKEAAIVFAAKPKSAEDSLANYQIYLKKPKSLQTKQGQFTSDPKFTKSKMINKQLWIDALHMASEIPGFYTRYLATIKEDLAVAVTFSASKDHFKLYNPVFDKVIESLRVFRPVTLKEYKQVAKIGNSKKTEDSVYMPLGLDIPSPSNQGKTKSSGGDDFIFFLLLGGAVVGYIVMKKLKGKKG